MNDVVHITRKSDAVKVAFSVAIKKVNLDERIVYGEVYAPYMIDTHGEMMFPEDVRLLCHRWLANKLTDQYDVMHDNELVDCYSVESFMARDSDPDYTPGAWVLGTKVSETDNTGLWDNVKAGDFSGYSVEMMVRKVPALAEILVYPRVFGFVEKNDGHDHAFYATVADDGRVTGGKTSEDAGSDGVYHSHIITLGTATNEDGGHSHRFFLP